MPTIKTAISYYCRLIATIAAVIFFSSVQNLQAKDSQSMTQKLWQEITPEEFAILKKVDLAVNSKNYEEALQYIKQENSSTGKKPKVFDVVSDIILWNKYSGKIEGKNIAFSDISRFVNDNAFYPNISEIKINVEKIAIKNNIAYKSSEQYFKANPAKTTSSKLYLLQSKITFLQRFKGYDSEKSSLKLEIKNLISEIWIKENLSEEEEKSFLDKYQNQLSEEDYIARINRLLWDNKIAEAKKIMTFVDEDHRKLFAAVIELQDFPRYLDTVVLSVPRRLRSSEILSYRRALWYKSKGRIDDLLDLMISLPKTLENPQQWWSMRNLYVREMIKKKDYKMAYLLAAKNSLLTTSADFWEAQWMSGWIALRFLNEPKEAYKHFENLYKNVRQPVTLSRGAYWLGMSSLAMGDKAKAIEWYKVAARYPTFFYGQLAINKHRTLDSINARDDIILPKDPEMASQDIKDISESRVARVAYLLAITGDKKNATKIFEYIVNNAASEGQIAVIMKVVNEIGDRQMDANISRTAAKKMSFLSKINFKLYKRLQMINMHHWCTQL